MDDKMSTFASPIRVNKLMVRWGEGGVRYPESVDRQVVVVVVEKSKDVNGDMESASYPQSVATTVM